MHNLIIFSFSSPEFTIKRNFVNVSIEFILIFIHALGESWTQFNFEKLSKTMKST